MSRDILLTQGYSAIIDSEDYELVSQYSWSVDKSNKIFYAVTAIPYKNKQKKVSMHRLIMRAEKGQVVDHKDRNGLNNQKENLRICTQSQNLANMKKRVGLSSKYKGVHWDKWTNKWSSCIWVNYKIVHLGRFKDEEEAARAYDEAAIKYFGNFARCNFSKGD